MLKDLLRTLKETQEELLELSYEKKQVIMSGNTERLTEIVRAEQRLLNKQKLTERKRAELMPQLIAQLGLRGKGITISEVTAALPINEREELQTLQRELLSVLNRQSEINKINKDLLNTQLEYTDAMLEVLVGSDDPLNNFYCGDGSAAPDKKRSTGFFDTQI